MMEMVTMMTMSSINIREATVAKMGRVHWDKPSVDKPTSTKKRSLVDIIHTHIQSTVHVHARGYYTPIKW